MPVANADLQYLHGLLFDILMLVVPEWLKLEVNHTLEYSVPGGHPCSPDYPITLD